MNKDDKLTVIRLYVLFDRSPQSIVTTRPQFKLEEVEKVLSEYRVRQYFRNLRTNRNHPVRQQGFSEWNDEILFQTYYRIQGGKKI
jgi:hypothetical protein